MSQHPPLRFVAVSRRTLFASIDDELLQEKASALGRIGRRLEADLRALADFDAVAGDATALDQNGAREALVAAAAGALWNLIVQREACGFSNSQTVLEDYDVPAVVRRRCGVVPLAVPASAASAARLSAKIRRRP